MTFIDKEHYKCQIIDFAIRYDTKVYDKEVDKFGKVLDLTKELKKVCNMIVKVVSLVIGAPVILLKS